MVENKFAQLLKALFALAVALFAVPAIIYVSWNMFAPDVFGLPQMSFKHAFGLFLFVSAMSLLVQMWGLRDKK